MKRTMWVMVVVCLLSGALPATAAKSKARTAGKKTAVVSAPVVPVDAPGAPGPEYQPVHAFTRMIGFDPHPSVTEYLQDAPLMVNGRPLSFTVETLETWKDEPVQLQEIGFKVVVLSNGQVVRTFDVPKKPVKAKEAKKGLVLGHMATDDLGCRFTLVEAQMEGKNIAGLTYEGQLLSRGDGPVATSAPVTVSETPAAVLPVVASAPVSPVAPQAVAASPEPTTGTDIPNVVSRLLEKAYSLPPDQEKVRLALLKKALLMLADQQNPGPAVENLIADLQAKTGQPITSEQGKPPLDQVAAPVVGVGIAQPGAVAPAATISEEARSLHDQAVRAFAMGQEPEGRDFLRRAVEKAPGYQQAWVLLGKNALKNSKYARAQEAFQQAVQLKDDDVESGVGFFKSCYYLGDAEKGIELLKGMVSRYPDRLAVREALAEAYYQAGDLESCLAECQVLLQRDPKNSRMQDLATRTSQKMK